MRNIRREECSSISGGCVTFKKTEVLAPFFTESCMENLFGSTNHFTNPISTQHHQLDKLSQAVCKDLSHMFLLGTKSISCSKVGTLIWQMFSFCAVVSILSITGIPMDFTSPIID